MIRPRRRLHAFPAAALALALAGAVAATGQITPALPAPAPAPGPQLLPPTGQPGALPPGPPDAGLIEEDRLRAIPDPWAWVPWAAGGTGAAALLGLGAWLGYRAWKNRPPPPPPDPLAVAVDALLATRPLAERGEALGFAEAASAAVRTYLEARLGLPVTERTTEEVLREAVHQPLLPPEDQAALRSFLDACDLAKFAGQRAGPDVLLRLLAGAETLVRGVDARVRAATLAAAA